MENELPKGWVEATLGDVADWGSGGTPKATETKYYDGDIPWLVIGDLNDGEIYSSTKTITRLGLESSSAKIVPINSVLIAMYGSIGKLGIAKIACATNQAIAFTQTIHGNIPYKFIYYYLFSFREELLKLGKGGAQQNISQTVLKEVPIPLPPLTEQLRIVTKLDAILARVNNCKTRLDNILTLLKSFRQSVLAAAVSGKLTKEWREKNLDYKAGVLKRKTFEINTDFRVTEELPKSWKWVALGNYADCSRGRFSVRPRNDPRYFNGEYPFIQIGDLPREGGYITSHIQTLNKEGFRVSKLFKKDTIAIAIVGATIGNSGILGYDMCFTDSLVGIDSGDSLSNLYLDYYLRNEKENFRQLSYASGGQPNIKLETLNSYPFPLAPIEEQKEIIRKVEELFHFADSIKARYQKAKDWFDKIPQAILAKAFKGELVHQDPGEEPASELLQKIKETQARTTAISKPRHVEAGVRTNVRIKKVKRTTQINTNMDVVEAIKNKFGEEKFSYKQLENVLKVSSKSEYIETKKQFFDLLRKTKFKKGENSLIAEYDKRTASIIYNLKVK